MRKIILDLCGGTGSWSKPYTDAGYDVRVITMPEQDVREYVPTERAYGILAAPPCTCFAGSGAKHWKDMPQSRLDEAVEIVQHCIRIILITEPVFYCIENPVGRLKNWLGPAVATFQPYEYGDAYTKKTCLWGKFNMPPKTDIVKPVFNPIFKLGPSDDRAMLRSITPPGFAKAFFLANQ